jgi:hypothetical protein
MPEINLQPQAVRVLHDCLHSGVFNSSAVKVDADTLADFELAFWLLGH